MGLSEREAIIHFDQRAIDEALDAYWAEYQANFPQGGDREDHDAAVACAVEAVMSMTVRWVTG